MSRVVVALHAAAALAMLVLLAPLYLQERATRCPCPAAVCDVPCSVCCDDPATPGLERCECNPTHEDGHDHAP